jgi:phage recombination protein Bet
MINDKILAEIKNLVPDSKTPHTYMDLIKSQVMSPGRDGKARPTEDLLLFLYVAKKTGLDPLARQIYAIYRWDSRLGKEKMTIQTGIDGLRLVAQRTGQYGGQDEPKVEYDKDGKVKSILVTVIKIMGTNLIRIPAKALMSEYAQYGKDGNLMGLWGKMPETMLEKCAESKALRKAFPAETTGIYTEEELPVQTITQELRELPKPEKKEVAPVAPVTPVVKVTDLRKEIK